MHLAWIAALCVQVHDAPRPWVDEIVYGIIIEKFFDGDRSNNFMKDRFLKDRSKYEGGFWGGDLRGVIDKLDEVASLGVTSILLYPVMQNDDGPIAKFLPTGYRPMDYENVDRNFGDVATLRSLVDRAHARRLGVILDMPITLPGFHHPYLTDPSKKGWFGPKSEYGVPRWKAENPEVADYLIGICKRWKERSNCDGFRLDSAHLQPVAFWKRFVAEIKAAPPSKPFVILPELTVNPREIGAFISGAGFDGAYDFSILRTRDVFGKGQDVGSLSFLAREAEQFYPDPRAMLAPIDNYEKAFVSIAKEPKSARTMLALTYILTIDRVPLLYAGNELALAFDEVGGAFPADRAASPFLARAKALIALRNREPALRRGEFAEVLARDPIYAFVRTLGDDRILVALNRSDRPMDVSAPIGGRPWAESGLTDLLDGEVVKPAGVAAPIKLEPFGARILAVK
jgi:alpha-amylase